MANMTKASKPQTQSRGNILADPEKRKKFKTQLAMITQEFGNIDKIKEQIKEDVAAISEEYGIDKKLINRLAKTLYKHDYASRQEEERHFRILYETLIENRLTAVDNDDDQRAA